MLENRSLRGTLPSSCRPHSGKLKLASFSLLDSCCRFSFQISCTILSTHFNSISILVLILAHIFSFRLLTISWMFSFVTSSVVITHCSSVCVCKNSDVVIKTDRAARRTEAHRTATSCTWECTHVPQTRPTCGSSTCVLSLT